MTNPTPSPLVVRTFMAKELLGWTNVHVYGKILIGVEPGENSAGLIEVPDWPGDRNIELPVDHYGEFLFAFGKIIGQKIPYWEDVPHAVVARLMKAATIELRLAWIRSEHGYKWVECDACLGGGKRPGFSEINESNPCKYCSGDAGEFKKI